MSKLIESSRLLALTPEEDAEFRRIGNLPIGNISVVEHQYYREMINKVFDWLEAHSGECTEPIPANGPAQCKNGYLLGLPQHPVSKNGETK